MNLFTEVLLLATHNQGKVKEYKALLTGLPYRLVTPAEVGLSLKVPENGASFEENAIAKATAYATHSRLITLADDSGLEVEALDGEPGVYSARYAGDSATDADRIRYLLSRLEGIPWEKRTARFRCVVALAIPGSKTEVFSGECQGIIALEPRGSFGFGYDPVFYLPKMHMTMAELPLEIKNQISHRTMAAKKARQFLEEWAKQEIHR